MGAFEEPPDELLPGLGAHATAAPQIAGPGARECRWQEAATSREGAGVLQRGEAEGGGLTKTGRGIFYSCIVKLADHVFQVED